MLLHQLGAGPLAALLLLLLWKLRVVKLWVVAQRRAGRQGTVQALLMEQPLLLLSPQLPDLMLSLQQLLLLLLLLVLSLHCLLVLQVRNLK